MMLDVQWLWLLAIGFAAGLMDAAVGGGGLLQLPGLINTLPADTRVAQIMGINKFASFNGTLVATGQYLRRLRVPWQMLLPAAVLAFRVFLAGRAAGGAYPHRLDETGCWW